MMRLIKLLLTNPIYNVQDLTDGTKQTFFGHEESETTNIADTWGDGPHKT